MAEKPEMKKPDFRNGFLVSGLGEGSMISGQADGDSMRKNDLCVRKQMESYGPFMVQ
jgi:hypothetical protein